MFFYSDDDAARIAGEGWTAKDEECAERGTIVCDGIIVQKGNSTAPQN